MFTPRINPTMRVTWQHPFLVVDDFLENIDEFREQLWRAGHFSHASSHASVPDVGPAHDWRQVIRPEDLPTAFREAIADLQRVPREDRILFNTNCLFSDMRVETRRARASYYPHSDWAGCVGELPIVFNLWLHDGGGGTGFYKYDGYASQSAMSPELRHFVENYFDESVEGFDPSAATQEFNSDFRGDESWELWSLAAMKKNRAFVYCGDLWHRVLIPRGEFVSPNARYSFVAFAHGGSRRFLSESGSAEYLGG